MDVDTTDPAPLTSLGLSGEAWPRTAALGRIDALAVQGVYIVTVEVFTRAPDGALEYAYEGWEAHDYDGDHEASNMRRGSAEAREFIASWEGDGAATPLFRLTLRSGDVFLDARE